MNSASSVDHHRASHTKVLRRLFLTLFLRGRMARGMKKETAPKSIARKLAMVLGLYGLIGIYATSLIGQPVFTISLYLHAMTFMLVGMFVAQTSGEVLFNKEEADILLHRPISMRALLWTKIRVLIEITLWLAGAFNLVGLYVGATAHDGNWSYPLIHAVSATLEAVFCTACIVLAYQVCLRVFGRERLDSFMTAVQVLVAVTFVAGSQIAPRLMASSHGFPTAGTQFSWLDVLPPAWFAGLDDVGVGAAQTSSFALAAIGLGATATAVWLAFGKLAANYGSGLQAIGESSAITENTKKRSGRLRAFTNTVVMRWWLRDSAARAAFELCVAYLVRDRDVKLRVYPAMAPMLIMPAVFMFRDGSSGSMGLAFASGFLGIVPFMAVTMLKYSQQWQAADIFRVAPLAGPAPLCQGARKAALVVLTAPLVLAVLVIALLMGADAKTVLLLIPGMLTLPLYSLIPCVGGKSVPLSLPGDESKSAGRGLVMIPVMIAAGLVSGLAILSWHFGVFHWYLIAELILVVGLHRMLSKKLERAAWGAME